MTGTFFPACVTVGDEFIAGRDLKFTSRGYELWSLSLPPCAVTDGDAADMQSHVFTCAQINRQSEQFPWMWWRAPPNRFLTTLYCCEAFYKLSLVKTVMMEIMAANALCDVNINLLINATERRQLMNVLLHSDDSEAAEHRRSALCLHEDVFFWGWAWDDVTERTRRESVLD